MHSKISISPSWLAMSFVACLGFDIRTVWVRAIQDNSYRNKDTDTSKNGACGGKCLDIRYQRLDRRRIAKIEFTSPMPWPSVAEKEERTLTVGINQFVSLSSLLVDPDR